MHCRNEVAMKQKETGKKLYFRFSTFFEAILPVMMLMGRPAGL